MTDRGSLLTTTWCLVLHEMLFGKLLSILGVAVASCRVVAAAPTEVNERSLKKRGATFTQACTSDDLAAIAGSVTELKDMVSFSLHSRMSILFTD